MSANIYQEYLDFSKDVMHLAELGFKQISVEPVVADEKRLCPQIR